MEQFPLGSLKRKRSGQKICECGKSFNNATIPKCCDKCGFQLGGSHEPPKVDIFTDAKVIKNLNLASVRLNKAGENLRVFVDLEENKVGFMLGFKNIATRKVQKDKLWEIPIFNSFLEY